MTEPLPFQQFNPKEDFFLQHLKAATEWHHRHLESQSLLQSLMLAEVTVEQYYGYLCLMKELAKTYERVVLPLLTECLPGFSQQLSSQLIEQDLEYLKPFVTNSRALQPFRMDSNEISIPFAWGFSYVMEGSKLGGKVIYKHITKSLNSHDNGGTRYLRGSGDNTSIPWKKFLQQLSCYAAAKARGEEIIQGAIFSFASIYEYFEVNSLPYED